MANIALKAMAIAIAIPYWSGRYRARIFAYCCPAKAQLIPSASKGNRHSVLLFGQTRSGTIICFCLESLRIIEQIVTILSCTL
jgi:hypothetical protein